MKTHLQEAYLKKYIQVACFLYFHDLNFYLLSLFELLHHLALYYPMSIFHLCNKYNNEMHDYFLPILGYFGHARCIKMDSYN